MGDVTIILPLKGREAYTPRWLKFHNRAGFHGPVLIGDGAPTDANERLVEQHRDDTGDDFIYMRYDDHDYTAFYKKLRDMVFRATTPYVIFADNDDFVFQSTLKKSTEFLDDNPEYVSCGGGVAGIYVCDSSFDLSRGVPEGISIFVKGLIYSSLLLDQDICYDRVLAVLTSYAPTYYAVHRRDALLESMDALLLAGIVDMQVWELFLAMYLAFLGKQKQATDSVGYLRQLNSSSLHATIPDFFDAVLTNSISRDMQTMVRIISEGCASGGEVTYEESRTGLSRALATHFRRSLRPHKAGGMLSGVPKRALRGLTHVARARSSFVDHMQYRRERAALKASLRNNGATEASLNEIMRDFDTAVETCLGR